MNFFKKFHIVYTGSLSENKLFTLSKKIWAIVSLGFHLITRSNYAINLVILLSYSLNQVNFKSLNFIFVRFA